MVIFEKKGTLTVECDKTNICHKFDVPSGLKSLKIRYSYSPKILADREKAAMLVRDCFEKYDEKMLTRPVDYLPVKNLVTISVDENGKYRGAAHRQADRQEHIISENFASPGFVKGKVSQGQWDIVLNVHSISCDVDYEIAVEGETL